MKKKIDLYLAAPLLFAILLKVAIEEGVLTSEKDILKYLEDFINSRR